MTLSSLPPEDLPSKIPVDHLLQRKLSQVVSQYFYDACDRSTQKVLSQCGWHLTTCATALTLVIVCPSSRINWQILRFLPSLAKSLTEFSTITKICIYPPPGEGTPMEVRVSPSLIYENFL